LINRLFGGLAILTMVFLSACASIYYSFTSNKDYILTEPTTTYILGRYSIDVPISMKQAHVRYTVSYTDVETIKWENPDNHKKERRVAWDNRIKELKKRSLPRGIKNIIIDYKDFSSDKYWAKGVYYYSNSSWDKYAGWYVLYDDGQYGAWLNIDGSSDRRDKMEEVIIKIADAYRSPSYQYNLTDIQATPKYYVEHGYFTLPFKYKEEIYTRFEGHPLDQYLKLSIESEVVSKVEETNLIERLSASLLMVFLTPGFSVEKIRTDTREVAGLVGDEVVIRGTQDGDVDLSFSWRFPGVANSATSPEILIDMESNGGHLSEKLKLWDGILNTFKPLSQ